MPPPSTAPSSVFDHWWSGDPSQKAQRVLTILLFVFVTRAITSFLSEYAFQKVGLSTVRDLRTSSTSG